MTSTTATAIPRFEATNGHASLYVPDRQHIAQVDHSDPLPYYYAPLTAPLYRRRLEMALELLGTGPYDSILEAGYGSGILLPSLCRRTEQLIAIDLHQRTDLVQRMLRSEGVSASLMVSNVNALPYADASFEALVCISTLEHLHGAELTFTIGEFQRVLRPGGIAVVGIPASGWAMDLLFRAIGFSEIGDHHVSTRRDIESELSRHFVVEDERRMPSFAPRGTALYTVVRCRRTAPPTVPLVIS
jgi:SAM-dependent methyltransferase